MARSVARAKFDLDLATGEAREAAFVRALQDCHVEHKSDKKAASTRNLFVEVQQKDPLTLEWKPSGIATTEAPWYAFEIFGRDCWIVVRTSVVRSLIRGEQLVRGGDDIDGDGEGDYLGALLPMATLVIDD